MEENKKTEDLFVYDYSYRDDIENNNAQVRLFCLSETYDFVIVIVPFVPLIVY